MAFFKIRVFQKKKWGCIFRHIVPLTFILNLFYAIYSYLVTDFNIPILILGVSYISISIIFSIRETFKNFDTGFSLIFFAYVFFYVACCLWSRFLFGLFYFINKWNDKGLKDKYFNKENF